MASIEKVCEFSGEYPGYMMYNYKKNLIQIMPRLRVHFRNKYHILFWFDVPTRNQYDFCLYVPKAQGEVDGFYWNYSFDKTTTKRKLKRMLRAYKGLNIKHIPMNMETWKKLDKKNEDLLEYL